MIKFSFKRAVSILSIFLILFSHTALAEAPAKGQVFTEDIEIIAIIPEDMLPPVFEGDKAEIKQYAYERVIGEWDGHQWKHFEELAMEESGWNNHAQNPYSSAYGIGQFLNQTWDDVGCTKTDHAETQVDCMIKYVKQRYKTPEKALKDWRWRKYNDPRGAWY